MPLLRLVDPPARVRNTWSPSAFGILALPVILALLGYLWILEERWGLAREEQEARLRGILTTAAADVHPEAFFRSIFRQLDLVVSWRNTLAGKKAAFDAVKRRFPGLCTFTVLEGSAEPVSALCDRLAPRVPLADWGSCFSVVFSLPISYACFRFPDSVDPVTPDFGPPLLNRPSTLYHRSDNRVLYLGTPAEA